MTHPRSRTMRLLILIIGAVALLGLVAAAACTSGDDDGGDGDNGDPTATVDAADDGDDGDDDDGGSTLADLLGVVDQYEAFTGVVTYDTSNFSSEGDLGSISIYQSGTSSRYEFGDGDGESIFITTPDASYQCADDMCLKLPGTGTIAAVLTSFFSIFGPAVIAANVGALPGGIDVDMSSESIAGIDATCFKYSGDLDATQTGNESSEMCFSSGGILLRMVFEDASGGGSIVATSASDTAPDPSVFEPPYPVEEFDTDLPDEVCDVFPDLC